MLELKNICKTYKTGELEQVALKNVSIAFRDSEFVSILGQSGGGKTTLLNIIGGLLKYTSGDLLINGKSTKSFKDSDWDYYRNVSVGFIFQSYNLIGHQTILKNVELALTLSGVNKKEREERARKALEDVGLSDHINKKPNQLSGGQMQRVAIARALVNNPDIILADEPTGALDSSTSLQIMELLKEIAKDRLVIMVTHNPELAKNYSTRIVKLKDGQIIDDSNPFEVKEKEDLFKTKKIRLNFLTALSLSFNNLLTKKARTILTAFAGSIGIIGIALILALSNGVSKFIEDSQRDALKSYPIQIQEQALDIGDSLKPIQMDEKKNKDGKVYTDNFMLDRSLTLTSSFKENNLSPFKKYLEKNKSKLNDYLGKYSLSYLYPTNFDIYSKDENGEYINTNGDDFESSQGQEWTKAFTQSTSNKNFRQLLTDKDGNVSKMVTEEYKIVDGHWPKESNEVILFTDNNNSVNTLALYELGLLPKEDYNKLKEKSDKGEKVSLEDKSFNPKDIIGHEFSVVSHANYYKKENDKFVSIEDDETKKNEEIDNSTKVKIVGIAKKNSSDEESNFSQEAVGYSEKFTDMMINEAKNSEVSKAQEANQSVNVLNNVAFKADSDKEKIESAKHYLENLDKEENLEISSWLLTNDESLNDKIKQAPLSASQSATSQGQSASQDISVVDIFMQEPDDKILLKIYDEFLKDFSYEDNMKDFGVVSKDAPSEIDIYVEKFEDRENFKKVISEYNKTANKDEKIAFTDLVGVMTTTVRTIINALTYVLVAFVGISLVVSSIMIGIITYISVLERTKEIGILRSIGASKGDITKVFLSETFIIGLLSGALGIGITEILTAPISHLIQNLTGVSNIAVILPAEAGLILILISVVLTLIAGIIPSRMAANKDPVEALSAE